MTAIDARALAQALETADWSGVSIGNKVLIRGAIDAIHGSRDAVIAECAHAAFQAYGSITSDQYVLEGPAGLAKRMINAVKGLATPRPSLSTPEK